jgi:hypothetical protein
MANTSPKRQRGTLDDALADRATLRLRRAARHFAGWSGRAQQRPARGTGSNVPRMRFGLVWRGRRRRMRESDPLPQQRRFDRDAGPEGQGHARTRSRLGNQSLDDE